MTEIAIGTEEASEEVGSRPGADFGFGDAVAEDGAREGFLTCKEALVYWVEETEPGYYGVDGLLDVFTVSHSWIGS